MDGAFGLAVTAIKARPDRVAIRKQRGGLKEWVKSFYCADLRKLPQ